MLLLLPTVRQLRVGIGGGKTSMNRGPPWRCTKTRENSTAAATTPGITSALVTMKHPFAGNGGPHDWFHPRTKGRVMTKGGWEFGLRLGYCVIALGFDATSECGSCRARRIGSLKPHSRKSNAGNLRSKATCGSVRPHQKEGRWPGPGTTISLSRQPFMGDIGQRRQ